MAQQQYAYGTVTIKRLPTGDNVQLTLNISRALAIVYNDNGVTTDWSSNPPVVTPRVISQRGQAVTVTQPKWYLDGTEIQFGEESGGKKTSTDGIFEMNTTTYALTIKSANIFSGIYYNRLLRFSCGVVVGSAAPMTFSKECEIQVLKAGENSYIGAITSGNTILDGTNTTVTLGTSLESSQGSVTSYAVVWYKSLPGTDAEITTGITDATKTLTLARGDVDGAIRIEAHFIVNSIVVAKAGITVIDMGDDYRVILSEEVSVEYGGTVSITPRLVRMPENGSPTSVTPQAWGVEVDNDKVLDDQTMDSEVPSTEYTFIPATGEFSMSETSMYYNPNATITADLYTGDRTAEFNPVVTFEAEI
jgi:hypothetical protein